MMEVLGLLETLEDIIREAKEVPLLKKAMINQDELLDIVDEIKLKIPEDIKQAKWITEERTRILQEAKKEAEDVVKEAEKRIIQMVDEHEITRQAEEKSFQIIDDAKMQAREISEGTKEYADSKLSEAEKSVLDILSKVQMQEEMLANILEKLKDDRRGLKR